MSRKDNGLRGRGGGGDGVVKDGVWIESGGEDRREGGEGSGGGRACFYV